MTIDCFDSAQSLAAHQETITPVSGEPLLALLTSLQLSDSFFPSGLYTLSHGLESFLHAGQLRQENLAPLLADYLRYGVGPADGAALACAHRGTAVGDLALVQAADQRLSAVKLAREARDSSTRTGRQLLALAAQLYGEPLIGYAATVRKGEAPGNHAIGLGMIFATQGVACEEALAADLYAFSAGCVSAALRLAVVDFRQAQHILHSLRPLIAAVARQQADAVLDNIGGCLPLAEVMAMRHEYAEVRMFVS
jgi:urease accessory protein